MEELGRQAAKCKALFARLEGITKAGEPYVSPVMTSHLRKTVSGYRRAIVKAATDILTAITIVAESQPEAPDNGKAA